MHIEEEVPNLRVIDNNSAAEYLDNGDLPNLIDEDIPSNVPTITQTSDKLSIKHYHNR